MQGNWARLQLLLLGFTCMLLLAVPSVAKTTRPSHKVVHKTTKSARTLSSAKTHAAKSRRTASRRGRKYAKKASWKNRGQKAIASDRATSIQEALIRENYLQGEPTGQWDQATKQAMVRYQEDHGWQTKMVPDSRALIQLGLGPSNDNLINPESAMTSRPQPTAVRENAVDVSGVQQ